MRHGDQIKPIYSIDATQDLTQFKHTEQVGDASQDFLINVVDAIADPVFVKDRQHRWVLFNEAFCNFLGHSRNELLGKSDFDFFPEHEAQVFREMDEVVFTSGKESVNEEVLTDSSGNSRTIVTKKSRFREPGGQLFIVGIIVDITDYKRMESDLMERESELRRKAEFQRILLDALASVGMQQMVIENDRIIHVGNRELAYRFGYTDAQIAAHPPFVDIIHPDDRERVISYHQRRIAGESAPDFYETGLVTLDGKRYDFEVAIAVLTETTPKRIVTIGKDITKRKRLENNLADMERHFRTLAENIPDNIIRYDCHGRAIYINPAMAMNVGTTKETFLGKTLRESAPQDTLGIEEYERKLCLVLDTGYPQTVEMVMPNPKGELRTYDVSLVAEHEQDGQVVGVLTIGRDITGHKRVEEQLRLAASVFETTRDGIIIVDTSGTILDVNSAFTYISGYGREEAIGAKPSILSSGKHDKEFYFRMWAKLLKQGYWSGEIINRRKNGEHYTEHLNITSVLDDKGKYIRFVGGFSDITHSKEQKKRLEYIAHHDALTGLPNRVLLSDRIQQAILHAQRTDAMFVILYLDLDGFKPVNDRFGHEVGDIVLKEIAQRLSDTLCASDTVARIGGDEFVLLLDQLNKKECVYNTNRVLAAVAQPIQVDGHKVTLSASIGISIYPDDGPDADTLLRHADQAMYTAKRTGRNQFIFGSQNVNEKTKLYSLLAHELRTALAHGEISVHFQPIVELATGRVFKAEALARWFHPELGAVSPAEFIPVAEDAGLIQELGSQVFRKVVHFTQEWNKFSLGENSGPYRVSANCSPRQFHSHEGLDSWIDYLINQGIPGELLDIEITEGLLLDDSPKVVKQLNQLQSQGVTLSLDDFGTGFSALSYLKKFNIDYLKIDRSFVRELEYNPDDIAIVEAIISMAHRLSITVIAEGVETKEQLAILAAANCDLAQGYFFAKPMPGEDFLKFIASGTRFDAMSKEAGLNSDEIV